MSSIIQHQVSGERTAITDAEVAARLAAVDWSFADRERHSELEALHPYPAKFIAEIPAAILDCIPLPAGTAVLDPFCGSGTTLVEAQRRGFSSVGVDLNPIACLIAKVRTSTAPPSLSDAAKELVRLANASSVAVPPIPNLDHWFNPDSRRALASLVAALDCFDNKVTRNALELALSRIIVRVSNQDSDTRYAAKPNDISAMEVMTLFERAARKIASALDTRKYDLLSAKIVEGDVLEIKSEAIGRNVGLVVTSPPYPNAYEYWLYHKYRMWWLGRDPIAVKAREIGARAHFFKKNHHTAQDFARQMGATFDLLSSVMVDGAYACFVVGRSRIHGETVDNARIIAEESRSRGFSRVFEAEREIASARKSFNLSHANIKTETILVLRLGV